MENAVKALFIACGIIITLATITIVVNIFIKNQIIINDGSTKVDFTTVAYHNSQFTPYEKDDLTYAELLSLIGVIVENNLRQTDEKYMVDVLLEKYNAKSGGVYTATGAFETVSQPMNSNFMNDKKYIYLNSTSVYKGKVFKTNLMYNDIGVIDTIKIEKIN